MSVLVRIVAAVCRIQTSPEDLVSMSVTVYLVLLERGARPILTNAIPILVCEVKTETFDNQNIWE